MNDTKDQNISQNTQNTEDTIPLTLFDNGQIVFSDTAVAQLEKGDTVYTPNFTFLNVKSEIKEQLYNDIAPEKELKNKVQSWLNTLINANLGGLIQFSDLPLNGQARGVAYHIYEQFGVVFRKDVENLIKDLSKEDRSALGKHGLRIAAYYVYHRDMLKPAAIDLRAKLLRVFHGLDAEKTPIPEAGNVSMAVQKSANERFYKTIGFPLFGHKAVRVDMIERLNSTIYDQAKDGQYTFDPAIASIIGVGVEDVQRILHDLGFRYEEKTIEPTEKPAEDTEKSEEKTENTIRIYHLKKRTAKPLKSGKANKKLNRKKDTPQNKEIDPDSPFAALQQLKTQK